MKNTLEVSGSNPDKAHLSYKTDGVVIAFNKEKNILIVNADNKDVINVELDSYDLLEIARLFDKASELDSITREKSFNTRFRIPISRISVDALTGVDLIKYRVSSLSSDLDISAKELGELTHRAIISDDYRAFKSNYKLYVSYEKIKQYGKQG